MKEHKLAPPLLYGISSRLSFPNLATDAYLELLFRTRADILQWREKDLSSEENRRLVRAGVRLARRTAKIFLVNSFTGLALDEEAAGVHLTSTQSVCEAVGLRENRKRSGFLIGKSVHSLRQAVDAETTGADYVLLSPIFEPLSKTTPFPWIGLSGLREAVQMLQIPVFALGGIDRENLEAVYSTGAAGAAGISWLRDEVRELIG